MTNIISDQVIDEAYTLNPSIGSGKGSLDPYRSAVIDTIVEQVQGRPGEDQAVLLLGYRKEMEAMLADANPGLSRRFQLENAFEFKDYSDEELLRILLQKCKKESVGIDMKTARFAIKQLAKAKAQQNFGNAGAINNLLSQAKLNMQSRNRKSKKAKDQFAKEDFCPYGKLPDEGKEEEIFSDLVGCDEIKEKLTEYRDTIDLAKSQGKNPKDKIEYNFLFVGPPG